MDDLVTWLLEQIAEDEREAREAIDRTTYSNRFIGGRMVKVENRPAPWHLRSQALWSPERGVAECEAKRRIIDAVQRGLDGHPGPCVNYEGQDPADYTNYDSCERHIEWSTTTLPMLAAQLLALPYVDRPGYREEWRP